MSSSEKAPKKSKEELEQEKSIRLAGVVPVLPNFQLDSARRVRLAWQWIPRLRLLILVAFAVSAIAMLASLWSVYTRPAPMMFLSLPDGTIACATLSDRTGKNLVRSAQYQAVCDRLVPPLGFEVGVDIHAAAMPPGQTPAARPAPASEQPSAQASGPESPTPLPASPGVSQ